MHKIKNMSPTELRVALLKAGIRQASLAREIGVNRVSVYKVVEGLAASDRIRRHIANRLGMDIKRIWPDPYLYHGGPRKAGRPTCEPSEQAA